MNRDFRAERRATCCAIVLLTLRPGLALAVDAKLRLPPAKDECRGKRSASRSTGATLGRGRSDPRAQSLARQVVRRSSRGCRKVVLGK